MHWKLKLQSVVSFVTFVSCVHELEVGALSAFPLPRWPLMFWDSPQSAWNISSYSGCAAALQPTMGKRSGGIDHSLRAGEHRSGQYLLASRVSIPELPWTSETMSDLTGVGVRGEKSDPQSLVLPCQLSSADVMGSTEHKSSRLNSQKTDKKKCMGN